MPINHKGSLDPQVPTRASKPTTQQYQERGIPQPKEENLIQTTTKLGKLIFSFAERNYQKMPAGWKKDTNYFRHLQTTTPESAEYRSYLQVKGKRHRVIAAFLWRVLVYEYFGRFHWAGGKRARAVREVRRYLKPGWLFCSRTYLIIFRNIMTLIHTHPQKKKRPAQTNECITSGFSKLHTSSPK